VLEWRDTHTQKYTRKYPKLESAICEYPCGCRETAPFPFQKSAESAILAAQPGSSPE
jgi:hypothetical protein